MASRVLYAPTIDHYQPAFQAGDGNGCVIKFKLSKFNGAQDFTSVQATVRKQDSGLSAVKKTGINTTGIILDIPCEKLKDTDGYYSILLEDSWIKSFTSSEEYPGFVPGISYQVQIRLAETSYAGDTEETSLTPYQWLNDKANTFSEWSTVTYIKAIPKVHIEVPTFNHFDNLKADNDSNKEETVYVDNLNFNGSYSCDVNGVKSTAEELYNYQVDIYQYNDGAKGNLLESSGVILSPEVLDEDGSISLTQKLIYNSKKEYTNNKNYIITLTCVTKNYFTYSLDFTVSYVTSLNDVIPIRVLSVDNDMPLSFVVNNNEYHTNHKGNPPGSKIVNAVSSVEKEESNARIALCLYYEKNEAISTNVIVKRSSSKDNYMVWEDFKIFNFVDESVLNPVSVGDIRKKVFYDYTIESGVYYRYATQTEDENGARTAIYDWVDFSPVARFFDATHLLGEGNVQLELKFDSAVTALKPTLNEAKTDTLGSQYPVFTRNGIVNYKTLTIGGLVSLHMDEDELFTSAEGLYTYADPISRLAGVEGEYGEQQYVYTYEKDFRNKVLEFLTDGKPKLYKSPTEGNLLVRLTDVNFVPNQQVGRLIGSFTATAAELDECNIDNYIYYNLLSLGTMVTDFAKTTCKIGQISGKFATKGFTEDAAGDNIIQAIYDKYNLKGQNIAGKAYTITALGGVRVTINGPQLRTEKGLRGFVLVYNGKEIYVPNTHGIYEFDPAIKFSSADTLYVLTDYEVDGKHTLEYADVMVDFIYYLKVDKYKGRQIKTKTLKRGMGQLHDWFKPGASLFAMVYNRYYYDADNVQLGGDNPDFRRLNSLYGIKIEANPGVTFQLQPDDQDTQTVVVGETGVLNFYNICDFSKALYMGVTNMKTGVLDTTQGADIIFDYFFYTIYGKYQEEV